MMIERIVSSYNPRVGFFVREVWRYPVVEKGGIPPEQHPAFKEDERFKDVDLWIARQERRNKYTTRGLLPAMIAEHLARNGPSSASQIASAIEGMKANYVTEALRRYADKFVVVGHGKNRYSVYAIWGLVEHR